MEIQLINYDSVNLTEEIIGVIEFGNVTIAMQGLSPEEVYTKTETDTLLADKSNTNHNHNLADLTEKSYNNLTDKPELFDGSYNSLSDVPSEFVPTSHNHSIANVTGLQTALDSKQATLVSGVNLKTINNISLLGSENIVISGGGGGTTDHAQLTNRDIADQHPISSITGLQTALNDKADVDSVYDISTMNEILSTKSDTSHNHSLNNLTEKNYSSLSNIPTEFNPSAHTQAINTIDGLQTALDGKEPIIAVSSTPSATKFLNELKQFTEIISGSGGFSNNVFFTNIDSDIVGYKKLSNTADTSVTNLTATVIDTDGQKLVRSYLYDLPIGVSIHDAGIWTAYFNAYVDSAVGDTRLIFEPFMRASNGNEITLFTEVSSELNNTTEQRITQTVNQPQFAVDSNSRFGVRIKVSTTSNIQKTVYTSIGGANASYFNSPIALRHSQLRGLNDDTNNLHVTSSEKSTWNGKAEISDIPTNFDSLYYRESEIDTLLSAKSDTTHNHTLASLTEKSYNFLTDKPTIPTLPIAITDVTNLQTTIDGKQATLVSGTNIKTINGGSVLGSGDIVISGGGGETVNIQTLTANKTLTASDAPIQIYTSTANRTINLPITGLTVGQKFEIWNKNDEGSSVYLAIKQDTNELYGVTAQTKIELRWDGANWITEWKYNISIGNGAYYNHTYGVGIGNQAYSNFSYGVGIGYNAYSNFSFGVGIGGDASYNHTYGVGIGYGATANSSFGVGIGAFASDNSTYGVGIGYGASCNSKQHCTVALGVYSKAERNREFVSTATASAANKAQMTIQKFIEKDLATNSAAFQELFIDGLSARLTIIASSVYHFRIQINAIDKTNFDVKTWDVVGAIKRNASNVTSLVSAVTKTVTSESAGASAWDAQVTADDTNEALKIEVKHNSANQVRFSLNIFATETRI